MSTSGEECLPAATTILLVDAEVDTLAYLHKGLSKNGFRVDRAISRERASSAIRVNQYDLVVLEVMLPDGDGWSVLREMRAAGNDTPVMFLTARDSIQDCVQSLELGADDYVIKPFAFSEFLARVRAVLRRRSRRSVEPPHVADLDIDIARGEARRAGRRLNLTRQEFALLCLLVRHAGEVLSRERLAREIWGIEFRRDTHIIDVAVRRLRTKVDEPFAIRLIHTVRGIGYRLQPSPLSR